MFFFIVRRVLISIPILLASTLLSFFLVTRMGDPLAELRLSRDPDIESQIETLRRLLDLDKPFLERYTAWLSGVVRLDFGQNRDGQDVWALLSAAMGTTFRLVILATIASILLGVTVGVITAVRQYSALDYMSTFSAFLFFSLPVFWLAVMLKEFGAIRFNDFLEAPGFSTTGIVLLSLAAGLFAAGLAGRQRQRKLIAFAAVTAIQAVLLVLLDRTDWMLNPGLSLPVVALLALGAGVLSAATFAPLETRNVLIAGVASAIIGVVITVVLDSYIAEMSWWRLLFLLVAALATGAGVGAAIGGEIDRRPAVRAGMGATFLVGVVVVFDRFISAWEPDRTIATIGPRTPNFEGDFWETLVDYVGHQILPSLALALIGFATFMRFTRSSMLDTMKSDYVRTAKAKGLPATQVIMRHAFRTALIPVMTVVAISFATVIEGAVITERVFGWSGMGTLFIEGVADIDPYPIMGFLVVTSISIIMLNMLADILYAYLDPRIRR